MEAMATNSSGTSFLTHLVLLLDILLLVAAFPARLRVVILKQKHPQTQCNNQSNNLVEKRVDSTPTLVPHSHAGGEQKVDNELEEDGEEVKQQTKLEKLDVRTKHVPDILHKKMSLIPTCQAKGLLLSKAVALLTCPKFTLVLSLSMHLVCGLTQCCEWLAVRWTHFVHHLDVFLFTDLVAGVPAGGGTFFYLGMFLCRP